ncbi:hypothetical protein JCM30566_16250 [Marinitoga arctica]
MNKKEILLKIDELISKSKTGLLAWIGKNDYPETRWMSPGLLSHISDSIFAITLSDFPKINDLKKNDKVQWMFQNPGLTEIINVYGRINIIEDSGFKSEALETLSRNLVAVWKLEDNTDFVVLETIIDKAVYYDTMKGIKVSTNFEEE